MRDVTRTYRLALEHNRTLKETVLRRRRVVAREVVALRGVDLEVEPGTALGVVGANGSGKSTLLSLIAGILPPDSGRIETSGRLVSMLELGAGFHPDFTGRENVVLNASIHGMRRREVERRMDDIVAFAELEEFIDAPVRTYSTGMYMRLGFAVATSVDPEILLLDEVLAVGDAAFQQKCIGRIGEFQRSDTTIVFVSHSDQAVMQVCDRAIWLADGSIRADGEPHEVVAAYGRARAGDAGEHDAGPARRARIFDVRVTNWREPTSRFRSGEPFRLEIGYETREPLVPLARIAISTVEGLLIAARDNGEHLDGRPATGLAWVAFSVPALPLLEGVFFVSVTLEDPANGALLHSSERCAQFTVVGDVPGHGPVALQGHWDTVTLSPPAHLPQA